jgi:hypothetical protein
LSLALDHGGGHAIGLCASAALAQAGWAPSADGLVRGTRDPGTRAGSTASAWTGAASAGSRESCAPPSPIGSAPIRALRARARACRDARCAQVAAQQPNPARRYAP